MDYLAALAEGEARHAARPLHTKENPHGSLPGPENPRTVPLELALPHQPCRRSEPLSLEVHRREGKCHLPRRRRPRGKPIWQPHSATKPAWKGRSVLFTTAIDVINTLSAAQSANRMKTEIKKYLTPTLLILDELGYLPIDKRGADLLFQVISLRYEQGSIIITSNRAYKHWPQIFNNDSTLTSALLDRLLHHAETVLIEGKSYRMKDKIES